MTSPLTVDALSRAMNALKYSLANYLQFARPWVDGDSRAIDDTVARVATNHDDRATRIGELLVERHGHVLSRTFPAAFAALNDLCIRYVLPLVIEDQRQIVRLLEAVAVELAGDVEAHDLVSGFIDQENRQLRALRQLSGDHPVTNRGARIHTVPHARMWSTSVHRPNKRIPRINEPVPEASVNLDRIARRTFAMLVLSRKADQRIAIGNDVWITVLKIVGNRVKVGIDAPDSRQIMRGELVPERSVGAVRPIARRAK